MNEIQLLREQLATERRHVRDVATACAAAHDASFARPDPATLPALARACTEYLGCVLGWFEQRDARLGTPGSPVESDGGRAALAQLSATSDARAAWADLARYIRGPWDRRRDAIAAHLETHANVSEWRRFAGVDADSIYLERALYDRVRAALPPGVPLP